MAVPQIRGVGAFGSGTTSFVAAVPTGGNAPQSGDLMLIIMESSDTTTAAGTPSTPADWAKVFEETEGAGATGVTTLTIFAKLAGASEADVTVSGVGAGTGQHCAGSMLVIHSHSLTVASDITVGTGQGGNSATATALAITPPSADSLIVVAVATTRDSNQDDLTFSAWTNANLSSLTEHEDQTVNTGAGGGVGYASGGKATTSSTGDTTVTVTSGQWRAVHLGVPSPAPLTESGTITAVGAHTYTDTAAIFNSGTVAATVVDSAAQTLVEAESAVIVSDFEVALTGWSQSHAEATLTRDTTEHHSGVASMKVVAAADNVGALTAEYVAVQGETLAIRMWGKAATGDNAYVPVTVHDAAHAYIANATIVSGNQNLIGNGAWQQIFVLVRVDSATAAYVRVQMRNSANGDITYWDDIKVTRVVAGGGVHTKAETLVEAGRIVSRPMLVGSYQSEVKTLGPAAYWRLGEQTGTVAYDSSPNGNNMNKAGAGPVTLAQDPLIVDPNDDATWFSDTGRYEIADTTSLSITGNVSIEAWVKVDTFPAGNDTYGNFVSKYNSWWLRVTRRADVQKASFYVWIAGNYRGVEVISMNVGQTYHLVGTYDGLRVRLYIDGVEYALATPWLGSMEDNNQAILVAAQGTGVCESTIDEVAIYPYALTAETVREHYAVGSTGWRAGQETVAEAGTIVATSEHTYTDDRVEHGTIVAGVGRYAATVLGSDPYGYWRLDDPTGSLVADDISGNGYDGTIAAGSTPVLESAGLIAADPDFAANFDGANDRIINYNDVFEFLGLAPCSFEAWVTAETIDTTYRRIFSLDATDGNGRQAYVLWVQDNGTNSRFGFDRYVNGAGTAAHTSNTGFQAAEGVTYHVVATFDGTNQRIYVDGVLWHTGPNTSASMPSTTANMCFGATGAGGGPWDGTLDELAIYDRALTLTEVRAHFNAGKNRSGVETIAESGTLVAVVVPAQTETLMEPASDTVVSVHAQAETLVEAGAFATVGALSASEATEGGGEIPESGTFVAVTVLTADEIEVEPGTLLTVSALDATESTTGDAIEAGTIVAVGVLAGAESPADTGTVASAGVLSAEEYRLSLDLYTAVDESPTDDTDYIRSKLCDGTPDVAELKLDSALDPQLSWGHSLTVRARKSGTAGDGIDLTVSLVEGTTVVASDTWTLADEWTRLSIDLTPEQADSITDYSDLRVRLSAVRSTDNSAQRRAVVSWVEFSTPAAELEPPVTESGTIVASSTLTGDEAPHETDALVAVSVFAADDVLAEPQTLVTAQALSGTEALAEAGAFVAVATLTATETLVEAQTLVAVSVLSGSEVSGGDAVESGTITAASVLSAAEALVEASTDTSVSALAAAEALAEAGTFESLSVLTATETAETTEADTLVATAALSANEAPAEAAALVAISTLSESQALVEAGTLVAISVLSGSEVAGGESAESGRVTSTSVLTAVERQVEAGALTATVTPSGAEAPAEATTLAAVVVDSATETLVEAGVLVAVATLSASESSSGINAESGAIVASSTLSGTEMLSESATLAAISTLAAAEALVETGALIATSALSGAEATDLSEAGALLATGAFSQAETLSESGTLLGVVSQAVAEALVEQTTILSTSLLSGDEAQAEAATAAAISLITAQEALSESSAATAVTTLTSTSAFLEPGTVVCVSILTGQEEPALVEQGALVTVAVLVGVGDIALPSIALNIQAHLVAVGPFAELVNVSPVGRLAIGGPQGDLVAIVYVGTLVPHPPEGEFVTPTRYASES